MDTGSLKEAAAERAVSRLTNGMAVGLGTGSTAYFVVAAVGRKLQEGRLHDLRCIPTSERTAEQARSLGIPLVDFDRYPALDVTIDGADEVSPKLDLVKGLGGALLREKIVAAASRRLIIVVDDGKLVPALGVKAPLPVEVVPFGWETLPARIRALGAETILRKNPDGKPFVTDGGHYILDCRWNRIDDPVDLERKLKSLVGVVETGLFIGMASEVIVAGQAGVREMTRP